jgi:hypothetical protein
MRKIDPADYQKRLDRMTELFSGMVRDAERLSETRCPYRDKHDECTAAFRCRNQGELRDGRPRPPCGHDGKLDYRSAWQSDPAAHQKTKDRIGRVKSEAAARRGGGPPKAEPR